MTATIPARSSRAADGLPAVERHAALPAGFRAGGLAAGIKASGRPDLAVIAVTDGRSGRRGRRLHPERVRGRARPPVASQPRGHVRRPAGRVRLGRRGHLDERLRQCRDGRGRRRRPGRGRRGSSPEATRHRRDRTSCTSRPAIIGTRLPLDKVAAGHRGARARSSSADDAALEAAADALRTTDSVDQGRDHDRRPARPGRRAQPCPSPSAASPRASG